MINHKPRRGTAAQAELEREKLKYREPFRLSGIEREIIILALNSLKDEISRFQDKKQEYGPLLTIKEYDIEMLQEYMRYG